MKISLEYYQAAFFQMHADLGDRLQLGFHAIRRNFWRLVPFRTFNPHEARELVLSYYNTVLAELQAILAKHSIGYWLHTYRRLAPRSIGPNAEPVTIKIVRRTLEASVQKFGLFPRG